MYTCGISDHGIVQARACFSSAPAPGEGIIPLPYILSEILSAAFVRDSCEDDCLPLGAEKTDCGMIIKAAAMFTREHLQDTAVEGDVFLKDQMLASISRVIWTQNISIATNMIDSSPIAAKYLKVSSSDDGSPTSVFLKDSLVFLKSAIPLEHLLFPSLQAKTNPDQTAFLSPILHLNWHA